MLLRFLSLAAFAALPSFALTIHADTVLDGKGGVLHNVTIKVDGSKIVDVKTGAAGPADYNLKGLTLMPGWIDTHVHIGWHFNRQDRADMTKEGPQEKALNAAGNAYVTLMAGFTTVQSLGAPDDADLRDAIARGIIPGPRLITSLQPLTEKSGTPEQIRALVRERVQQGADVIKLFATKSVREGGAQTMTDAQIQAACGEATALGKRSVVHAHSSGGATAAILAGCTSIEHGSTLDNATLDLLASHGTYFDPNISTTYNYLEHKKEYLGIGNYNEEGFAYMEKTLPIRVETLHRALARKIKIVFGTDAVAGAHGRNAEEFIYRVRDGGQKPMDAIISATSRAAEALRIDKEVGVIAPGMQADFVATNGNPVDEIRAVRSVCFVMKAGKVYRYQPSAAQ
ncbi:MAG TPA: amidohydrolase family protein [Bryobacteraceae bacterium]|jgi:imidazolonepropionase-like amidohydrolase